MLTPEQLAQNREYAKQAVRRQLGLSDTPSEWRYEQRVLYVKTLSEFIKARPEEFTAQDVSSAGQVSAQNLTALDDERFNFGMFATETLKPLGDAAQSIGNGVLSVANAAKWAIPAAAVVGGVLLFLWANKKLGGVVPRLKQ